MTGKPAIESEFFHQNNWLKPSIKIKHPVNCSLHAYVL
jgi:hypothetical protein